MAKESDYQASLIKWLRQHGAFAWKMQQNATTRVIECKKDKSSPLRPGQQEFLDEQSEHVFAELAYPEIDEDIKLRLLDYFEEIKNRPNNAKKCRKCFIEGCDNLTRHPGGELWNSLGSELRSAALFAPLKRRSPP